MFQLLVIADDFTGALDTGSQFSGCGISTDVYLYDRLTKDSLANCSSQVAVVDTQSRHLPAEAAASRVRTVMEMAMDLGCRHYYKKTDSTLRGNIGSELTAMLAAAGQKRLFFVPAFPSMGRRTVGGVQYVGEIPLAQSEFAGDPFNPVRHSCVAEVIAEQSAIAARSVSFRDCALLPPAETPEILIVDGQTDEDLYRTALSLTGREDVACLAGCAGFAAMLPGLLLLESQREQTALPAGGILLACGSVHPQSVRQCRWAVEHCGYRDNPLTMEQMLGDPENCGQLAAAVAQSLSLGGNAIVRVAGGRERMAQAYREGERIGLSEKQVPGRIAENMGKLVRRILTNRPETALIVFGGDTLLGIATAMECGRVVPLRELCPGVVLSRMYCPTGIGTLITKAGGFGEETIVEEIGKALVEMREESRLGK